MNSFISSSPRSGTGAECFRNCSSDLARRGFGALLAIAAALVLFASARAAEPAAQAPDSALPSSPAADAIGDYEIGPADILEISVFQEPDLKSSLRVSNEGTITFPLVGIIDVGGLSPHDAAVALQKRLADGYLINPQVTVTVTEFSKRRFTVLGEVQKPGSFDIPDQQKVTVLQAIGMAGGYTRIANPSHVTIMRQMGAKRSTFELNARRMATGNSEAAFLVMPGDVITIAESRF